VAKTRFIIVIRRPAIGEDETRMTLLKVPLFSRRSYRFHPSHPFIAAGTVLSRSPLSFRPRFLFFSISFFGSARGGTNEREVACRLSKSLFSFYVGRLPTFPWSSARIVLSIFLLFFVSGRGENFVLSPSSSVLLPSLSWPPAFGMWRRRVFPPFLVLTSLILLSLTGGNTYGGQAEGLRPVRSSAPPSRFPPLPRTLKILPNLSGCFRLFL